MRKFNVNMYNYLVKNAKHYTISELISIVYDKYNEEYTKKELATYLIHKGIKYKYEMPKKVNNGKPTIIGTEAIKTDGQMYKIKVGNHKWAYKQRLIYEQAHNIKLPKDVYVIFLDQDKTNFDIKNLKAISRRKSAIMSKDHLFFEDRKLTKFGTIIATLKERGKDLNETINSKRIV